MKLELICIGTELLGGKLNTNSAYLGEKLSSIGIDPSYITTVGDNTEELEAVFKQALKRSRIIIATGGLGPTFDDLTRETLAKILDRRLVLDRDSLSAIARRFLERNIEMPKNNERQAYIIEGAKAVPNQNGTAPGQIIEIEEKQDKSKKRGAVIILLPGPPREMQLMFENSVLPYLKKFERSIKKSFTLHVFGLPESLVDEKIHDIIESTKKIEADSVDWTILAHQLIVDIKAFVCGKDELLIDETLNNLKKELYDVLGNDVYGENRQSLESIAGELLARRKKTLSIAESCTGGLLSARITSIPGSSMYFRQGVVSYSNESKIKLLQVKQESIQSFGAVSEQTAQEMAAGIKSISGSDYALSITGIAGPSGGTPEKPVGLVYICLAGPNGNSVSNYKFTGTRAEIRERAANHALDLLRRELLKSESKRLAN